MTILTGPLKWYTVCAGITDAVSTALSTAVSRACVVPGAIAWDAGECGLLAVSLTQVNPSNEFPITEATSLGNCTPALEVAEIVLQVMRCAPGIGEASDQLGALAPACEDLDASAQVTTQDAHEILVSVTAYMNSLRYDIEVIDWMPGSVVTMGPEGGVVGNEMRLMVGLPFG